MCLTTITRKWQKHEMIGLYHKALQCNTNATQRKGRKKEEKRTKREVNKRSKRNSLVILKNKKEY